MLEHNLPRPSVGKTHLAVALGLKTMSRDVGVYFINTRDVAADLQRAGRENRLERMKVHVSPKLLIADEIGYLPLDQRGATILFQLVTSRYDNGPTILASNTGFSK